MPTNHHRNPSLVRDSSVFDEVLGSNAQTSKPETGGNSPNNSSEEQAFAPITIAAHGTSASFAGATSSSSGMGFASGSVSFSFTLPDLPTEAQGAAPSLAQTQGSESPRDTSSNSNVSAPTADEVLQKPQLAKSPSAHETTPKNFKVKRSRRTGLRRWLLKSKAQALSNAAAGASAAPVVSAVPGARACAKGSLKALRINTAFRRRQRVAEAATAVVSPGLSQWVKAQNANAEAKILDAARLAESEAAVIQGPQHMLLASALLAPMLMMLMLWCSNTSEEDGAAIPVD
eukprot:INCI3108.1.p1 GENE.INCI3108.1~~INCI3108.1.p1  ORF type:complete len:288 (+),score=51.64 INCI3108.1:207-1070(+)